MLFLLGYQNHPLNKSWEHVTPKLPLTDPAVSACLSLSPSLSNILYCYTIHIGLYEAWYSQRVPKKKQNPRSHFSLMAVSEEKKRILVTGGAGFIGSHTVLQLLKQGFLVSIIDNFDNSCEEAVERVRDLAGPQLSKNLQFHLGDLRNLEDLERVFSETRFDAVIHFAGLKAVGESMAKPLLYYNNNMIGTIHLYGVMAKYGCK